MRDSKMNVLEMSLLHNKILLMQAASLLVHS